MFRKWRSSYAGGTRSFSQHLKSMEVESQCTRDEEGRLLRVKDLITPRWAKKAEKLGPDVTSKLPQQTFKAN